MDTITTCTVTIGRNVGETPMRMSDWEAFQEDVRTILGQEMGQDSSWIETHYGEAERNGVREQSAKITILDTLNASGIIRVRGPLGKVCAEYGQDAVVLSVGMSGLIYPTKVTA